MRRGLLIFFIFSIVATGMPLSEAAALDTYRSQVESSMQPEMGHEVNKKRNKAYKKRKNKKILGIFKRKSACDCPKH